MMKTQRISKGDMLRSFLFFWLLSMLLTGCLGIETKMSAAPPQPPTEAAVESGKAGECPVTEPAWVKPPDDTAVQGSPGYGYYYLNADSSIWASAWWTGEEDSPLRAGEEGNKMGWFRPEGVKLKITGKRIDAQSPPLEAHIPCCYPTRFQATGLSFPTPGCWEVTAKAADRVLTFVVTVEP